MTSPAPHLKANPSLDRVPDPDDSVHLRETRRGTIVSPEKKLPAPSSHRALTKVQIRRKQGRSGVRASRTCDRHLTTERHRVCDRGLEVQRFSAWAPNASGGRKRKGVPRRQAGGAATSQGRLAATSILTGKDECPWNQPGEGRLPVPPGFQSSKTDFGPRGSRAARTHFCFLKPPALWSPVTAATGSYLSHGPVTRGVPC